MIVSVLEITLSATETLIIHLDVIHESCVLPQRTRKYVFDTVLHVVQFGYNLGEGGFRVYPERRFGSSKFEGKFAKG